MKVHAIETGKVAVKTRQLEGAGPGPLRLMRTLADRNWTDRLPIHAWLIEHPEGLIVVDSGETARVKDPGYFPAWQPYFKLAVREWVSPAEEIGPRLRELGFSPGDVRWVVLTHLHTDHAGGLEHFPDAEILVSRTEYEAARGARGKLRGFLPHRWPSWFAPRLLDFAEEPYGPFPRSLRLTEAGDVVVLATPGHTPGHVSVVQEEGERAIFFAGDTSYTEAHMLRGAVDGVSARPSAARVTLERIQALAAERPTVYLPSHDPGAAARLAGRTAAAEAPAASAQV